MQKGEPMSRLIDADAMIGRINKLREHLRPDIYPQDAIGDSAYRVCAEFIELLPSEQPEITLESAIDYLHSIGWMQSHDKQIFEDGQRRAQPEIIRCKDCKYWQDQEEGVVEVPICARPENKYEKFPLVMLIGGDGFCSYAERRIDEQTD